MPKAEFAAGTPQWIAGQLQVREVAVGREGGEAGTERVVTGEQRGPPGMLDPASPPTVNTLTEAVPLTEPRPRRPGVDHPFGRPSVLVTEVSSNMCS